VDAIQTYFTKDSVITSFVEKILVSPQVYNCNGIIEDSINWVRIKGSFVAVGGERFLTIGNFMENDSIDFISYVPFNTGTAYYFFDDLSVYECDAPVYQADAGPDRSICFGDSVRLGSHEYEDYWYYWSDEAGRSFSRKGRPWVKPLKTTTYYLYQKDFKFDESYSSATVYVEECEEELIIPNVFTPNYDGFNDKLEIINRKHFEYVIEIYDRWGRKIFSGNQTDHWDGTTSLVSEGAHNQQVSAGVYYYSLTAVTKEGKELRYSGAVQLVR
jgi:gliding motility-associated-like protein